MLDRIPIPGDYIKLDYWHGKVLEVYGTPDSYAIKVMLVKNLFQHNIPEIHTSDTLRHLSEFSTAEETAKEIALRMKLLKDALRNSFPEAIECLK